MNKKIVTVIVVILLLLLLLVGGLYFMKKSPQIAMQNETGKSQNAAQDQVQKPSAMTTLKDLLTSGSSQKCTFEEKSDSFSVSGTTYISGGKVRSDYSSGVGTVMSSGHMITDGKTSYIWTEGQTTGFKMAFDEANSDGSTNTTKDKTTTPTDTTTSKEGVDPNKAMNYNCSGWSADNSMFTPPANIKFSDLNSMKSPSTTGNNQCSVCNSLSGEEKTQCLSALKCN